MKTDQDVNEATAALKGLLGLSTTSSPVRVTGNKPDSPINNVDTHVTQKKKRSNNKKKKSNDVVKIEETKKSNDTSSRSNEGNATKKKKNQKKKIQKEPESYALSAFQSSPDASKLPIPEFTSPVSESKSVRDSESSEVFREISAEQHVNNFEQKLEQTKKLVEEKDNDSSKEKEPEVESRNDAPVSATGINLAALASKPTQSSAVSGAPQPPPQSILSNDDTSHPIPQQGPHHFGITSPNPHLNPSHMHFSSHQHQIPAHQYHPLHHHHYPYPPPPPPGYILIQVQVPPVLLQGRQMIVTTPAGYPVQVVVPEGVPPGMFIPVHVPVGPPHMLPHPMPMMQQQGLPPQGHYESMSGDGQYSPSRR